MSPTPGLSHSAPGMEKTLSVPTRPVQLSQVMLAGMLCMALLGAATTYYGPTLVYVAAESNQPIAAVGVVFAMHGAGFFLSTLIANRLARRFEMRRGVVIGCLFVGLGAGALLLTFSPRLALLGFGLAGLAFSVVFTTMLAWAARRHPTLRTQMASISMASAGLGSMFVPSLIGVAVGAVGAWSLTPILIGTALVVAGLSFFERGRV